MRNKLQTTNDAKSNFLYIYKYGTIGIDYIFCWDEKKEY